MKIRKASLADINDIMVVVDEAKALLASEGIDQWQDGFPNPDVIKTDIEQWESYVMEDDNEIVGFFTLALTPDEGYKTLYDGKWLVDGESYSTIHRTAISSKLRGKGASKIMFDFCENLSKRCLVKSIRVDTHKDNSRMRHVIEREGYTYCGYILLAHSGKERVVYEKILKN